MTKEEKFQLVEELSNELRSVGGFFIADTSGLTANQTVELRKLCHDKGVSLRVVKNTLIAKVLENLEITDEGLVGQLKGPSSIMLHTETVNAPAKLIKEARKSFERPLLKAAFIDEAVYVGDEQLDALAALKSKEELVADVIALLQSPMKNVVNALQASAGNKIHRLLETLSNKED